MNWRRWVVLATTWVGFLYLYVDPGHDIYKEAIVSVSIGPGLVVPLDISAEGVNKALDNYHREIDPGIPVTDTQLAGDAKLVWAEISNSVERNQREHRAQWRDFVIFSAVVPGVILGLGVVIGWVMSGFRARASRQ